MSFPAVAAPQDPVPALIDLPAPAAMHATKIAGPTWDGTPLAALERSAVGSVAPGAALDSHGELLPTDGGLQEGASAPAATSASAEPLAPAVQLPAMDLDSDQVASGDGVNAVADAGAGDPASPPENAVESLRDAIVASLKQNPEIQIALAQQDDALYGVDEARAGFLPHVDIQAGWGREYTQTATQASTQRYRTEATITLNQNIWDFGVTSNDIRRARASYRSAQWGTRERIEAISYDITNAYLAVLLQQKLLVLTENEIAAVKKIVRIVTVQKDLGLTTPADVGRAQTRLENVQSLLLDRKSALQQARTAYKRLTNHLPARVRELPLAGAALPETVEVAVDMMESRAPRLAQAVEDRRSLDRQYDSQSGTFFPRVGFQVQGNHREDVLGNTGRANDARAMITLSYKLFNGGADLALRRRIGARLRQADYELDRRRREVEQDIRIDYEALNAARQKIGTINAEIESAQKVADLYKQQFREGRRTVFELLDSQQVLFNARANQYTNEIAMRAAEYRVLQKLGGLFDLVSEGEPLGPISVPAPGASD
ncbi:TolC family outer membrane protein [Novosphingobium cyanobacteriorum]|uniref:TolC family outer membrane protein n=1 Tax=Novosphingobium cyanobacteriorum TaxID=3024215 RepID=A0ABT6CMP2_9SPHN|nr:TolC family outer membrane protein [Novosphingobium cyanobacteriorum]MDF8335180.1 TolC family outer membrane protein [Novosphingobium cyanobacteriorum]